MAQVYQLFGTDNCFLYISERDFKRFLVLSYGICQAKSVNIQSVDNEIAIDISGCKASGQYKWLVSAFQTGNTIPIFRQVFSVLVGLFYHGENHLCLLIDRRNWEIGLRKVNILSIGFLYKASYIALLHEDLVYKGNSDSETRLALIKQLISWWKMLNIPMPTFEIVGDREFIGEDWLYALEQLGVTYVIRLKSGLNFYEWLEENGMSTDKISVGNMMKKHHKKGQLSTEVVIKEEVIVHIVSTKNEGKDKDKEKYIYLITNKEDIENTANVYRKRWRIETCFKHLKTAGFNLEDMNLDAPHKTDILMAILSLVYAMVIYAATEVEQQKPIKEQVYRNGKTFKRKATFMIGKAILVKLKVWSEFIVFVIQVIDTAINNLLFLNKLNIKKNYG
jgi:transposase